MSCEASNTHCGKVYVSFSKSERYLPCSSAKGANSQMRHSYRKFGTNRLRYLSATVPDLTEKPGHFRERQRLFSQCLYFQASLRQKKAESLA